jgi:hypothetical protein
VPRPNIVLFGCPRSGTSLFLETFATLGWSTYFEPGMDFVTDSLMAEGTTRKQSWVIKNPIDLGGYRTPGLSCNLDTLRAAVGDAKMMWVVRHPLDTVCSLRPGLEKWQHQPLPPSWLRLHGDARGVEMWRWVNGTGKAAVGDDVPVLRYEDLLLHASTQVKAIGLHADVEFPQTLVSAVEKAVSLVPGVREAAHQGRWTTPHAHHLDRWRDDMTVNQAQYACDELRVVARHFGYYLPEQVG